MKKWYQENYFSRRNWILENLSKLKLTGNQAMVLMMIDYDNEFRQPITIELLSQQTNLKTDQIDKIVMDLCQKEYLQIVSRNRKIVYDISGLFEEKPKIALPRHHQGLERSPEDEQAQHELHRQDPGERRQWQVRRQIRSSFMKNC